ncbi:MAG: hypothetical protein EBZ77_17815 [Chitinophagia bacterium]|nr:hypothetical protein [Chitinophagia bacterium]
MERSHDWVDNVLNSAKGKTMPYHAGTYDGVMAKLSRPMPAKGSMRWVWVKAIAAGLVIAALNLGSIYRHYLQQGNSPALYEVLENDYTELNNY